MISEKDKKIILSCFYNAFKQEIKIFNYETFTNNLKLKERNIGEKKTPMDFYI